jgi:hypothetical protein
MTTLHLRKSISRSPLRLGFLLIPVVLACFALAPTAQATKPPKPEDRGNSNSAAENVDALNLATTGSENTAHGWSSLFTNDTGSFNTADGFQALFHNVTGFNNVAIGWRALVENTIGFQNTATGAAALHDNTTGIDNTAVGAAALYTNTTGRFNTATGFQALAQNTTGDANTADGINSLLNNTTGHHNTAIGEAALNGNTTGQLNTAVGVSALASNITGGANIALGYGAGGFITGDYNIDIGNGGVPGEDTTIRIGENQLQLDTYIAGIFGTNLVGSSVVVTADGHLGVGGASSARFKDEIKPMDKASEAILALKPVTFYYKKEIDPNRTAQFGLVAEEVEKVNSSLIARDRNGKPYTVRYDAVNAMLLNEFLKEHRRVEALQASFAQQQKDFQATVAQQQKQIEALSAGLQKVSAQVEMGRPAPHTVVDNH